MIRTLRSIIFSSFLLSAVLIAHASTNNSTMSMSSNMMPEQHLKMVQDSMQQMDPMMMDALGKKDKNYDLRFMDLMIMHHEGGVKMAKDALKNSDRPEIKEMAQNIIDSQEKEIAQMKKWKKEWYNQ